VSSAPSRTDISTESIASMAVSKTQFRDTVLSQGRELMSGSEFPPVTPTSYSSRYAYRIAVGHVAASFTISHALSLTIARRFSLFVGTQLIDDAERVRGR
jgi:polyisoprenoid-binding protein YceI